VQSHECTNQLEIIDQNIVHFPDRARVHTSCTLSFGCNIHELRLGITPPC